MDSVKVVSHTECRVCKGTLKTVVDLGELCISTFTEGQDVPKVPMELCVCSSCSLVQLRHTIDGEVMYRDYWYKSGLNANMVKSLEDVVNKTHNIIGGFGVWVDIGSNDNTMLDYVNREIATYFTVGFDPTKMERKDPHLFINDFFTAKTYWKRIGKSQRKALVVSSIACFYDMEDPHTFVKDVVDIMEDNGVFVIQMMDLMSMWKTHDFANICHEHLEYYSLTTLAKLLAAHDLDIFDLEWNDVNGGSLRVYVKKHICTKYAITSNVTDGFLKEAAYFSTLQQQHGDAFAYFRDKIESIKTKINVFIKQEVESGKQVAVFGASTKGNTILQYFNLDCTLINHAAEVNPDKFGLKTVATNIPIIDQERSLSLFPDYYFVLPHGFIRFFIEKHGNYLANGGKFIVALPEPAIIQKDINGEVIWTSL